jgi:hypothetical protein
VTGDVCQHLIHIAAAEGHQAKITIQGSIGKGAPAGGWINPDKGGVSIEHSEKLGPRFKKSGNLSWTMRDTLL